MRGNSPVRFGKGPTEKDPNHGHLAGGLFHSGGGRPEKDQQTLAPRQTAYLTRSNAPPRRTGKPSAWAKGAR
jgi:hypothetical protein